HPRCAVRGRRRDSCVDLSARGRARSTALAMATPMKRAESPSRLDASEFERYQVHSRLEIVAILRSLIEHRSLVTVSFGGRDDFIVSALLAVNPDFEELIIDHGADPATNVRLLQAPRL